MKKIFVLLLSIAMCHISIAAIASPEGYDNNKYNILDEAGFAVLIYDTHTSLEQNLGQENQIDGFFNRAFIMGRLDLLKIKAQTINVMNKEKVSIIKGGFTEKQKTLILKPLQNAIDEIVKNTKRKEFSDAMIYAYMQMTDMYRQKNITDIPNHITHLATNIAINRFDNRYWYKTINNCFQKKYKNKSEQDMANIIDDCAKNYKKNIIKETQKVLEELKPYYNKELSFGL